jgi:cell division protein ZapA (FtsZ GTPase activity inhibitor)
MKKIVILGCLIFTVAFSVHSLDSGKARKAVMEQDYIPALMDYGFTEQQIRSWTTIGNYIKNYLADLKRSGRYASRSATTMSIQVQVLNKVITENDMAKIDQFLKDIEAFWMNELSREEEATRQRAQAEEQRRAQAREQQERELTQYAESFGLIDYVDGIIETQMEVTPNNLELLKKVMILPNDVDQLYSVQNIVDGYVVYSAVLRGTVYQVALMPEQGKTYPANSPIDLNSVYKVEGTTRFARTFGGSADLIVIRRLGPRR